MVYLIIYITGFICDYLFNRWIHKDEWTVSKKTITLFCCLLSWIWFLYIILKGVINYIDYCLINNNKAKW